MSGPVSRAFDAMAVRAMRRDQTLVREPGQVRRLFVLDLIEVLTCFAALILHGILPLGLNLLPWIVFVLTFWPRVSMRRTQRAKLYRWGWLAGRSEYVNAMEESARRDIPFPDFLRGEVERDFSVLMAGERPPPPPAPREDDS